MEHHQAVSDTDEPDVPRHDRHQTDEIQIVPVKLACFGTIFFTKKNKNKNNKEFKF